MQACCGEAEGVCPFAAAAAAALLLLPVCLSALAVCGESSWLRPYGVSAVIQSPERSNQHRSNKQQQQQQQPPAFSHSAPPGFDSGAAVAAAPTAAAASDSASAADEPVAPSSATVASSGSSASAALSAGVRQQQQERDEVSSQEAPFPFSGCSSSINRSNRCSSSSSSSSRNTGVPRRLGHVPSFYYDADPSEPQQQQEQQQQQQQQQQRVGSPQQQQKQQDLLISRRSSRISYNEATRNFADSLAAYAVLNYLLQVKDRRNGNVLVSHSSGRLLHVDFGFFLELSPGGDLAFERAPLKLTAEMAALLGTEQGVLFKAFSSKCIQGAWFPRFVPSFLCFSLSVSFNWPLNLQLVLSLFLCLRETADDLVFLLEALQLARLQLQLSPLQAAAFMEAKIREALQSFTTRAYDVVQHLQQGIAH
ncbi:hypothetical protein Efla_003242 [Eimeria flavescens]